MVAVAAGSVAVSTAAAGRADTRMLDLSAGTLDGHRVLGRTVAGVTAGLGRPDFRLRGGGRYRIGWGTPTRFSVEVIFRRTGGAYRAWSIALGHGGPVADVRVGDLLNRSSAALQHAIAAKYRGVFQLVRSYACTRKAYCVGEFAQRDGALHLTFGTLGRTGTWVTLWTAS